eukprot:CAMPEP_0202885228 /NCGR_PEP_ID=MMETSP1391-20130828/41553_1 /ASSEMBLY_ACC=CAM_ASM_000867 /TAXON_ID=1034604 /ORGANISM="Chlamydomonas leiostraca, Strain SAG 11-49" /LENGTH=428 /DNA_ID=CAMNT_0049568471 /DNA_START=3381 /DNA_END=4664 /DNA_ORIENTATION=-
MSTDSGNGGIEACASPRIDTINQQAYERLVASPAEFLPPPPLNQNGEHVVSFTRQFTTPIVGAFVPAGPTDNPRFGFGTATQPSAVDVGGRGGYGADMYEDQSYPPVPAPRIQGQAFSAVTVFDGGMGSSQAVLWLSQLDRTADFYQLPNDVRLRLALAKLTNAAAAWAMANNSRLVTWTAFKDMFVRRFGETRSVLLRQYNNAMQRPDESAQSFAERLAVLRNQLHMPADDIAMSRFVEGLKYDLQLAVTSHCAETLDDAIQHAVYMEDSMWASTAHTLDRPRSTYRACVQPGHGAFMAENPQPSKPLQTYMVMSASSGYDHPYSHVADDEQFECSNNDSCQVWDEPSDPDEVRFDYNSDNGFEAAPFAGQPQYNDSDSDFDHQWGYWDVAEGPGSCQGSMSMSDGYTQPQQLQMWDDGWYDDYPHG